MVAALQTTGLGLATNYREEEIVPKVAIDGVVHEAQPDEFLIDLINRRLTRKDSLRGLGCGDGFVRLWTSPPLIRESEIAT